MSYIKTLLNGIKEVFLKKKDFEDVKNDHGFGYTKTKPKELAHWNITDFEGDGSLDYYWLDCLADDVDFNKTLKVVVTINGKTTECVPKIWMPWSMYYIGNLRLIMEANEVEDLSPYEDTGEDFGFELYWDGTDENKAPPFDVYFDGKTGLEYDIKLEGLYEEVHSIKTDYIYKPLPLDTTDYELARLDTKYLYYIDDDKGIDIDFDPDSGIVGQCIFGNVRHYVSPDNSWGGIQGEWFYAGWDDDGSGNRIWDYWEVYDGGGSGFDPTELWNAIDELEGNKMNKTDPMGAGSFSVNRKSGTTIGWHSVAVGDNTTASDNYSFAEGAVTKALGYASHAEGFDTTASSSEAHAEGIFTTASGSYSHAEGNTSIASGRASHAEGEQSSATGNYSHAEGYMTIASDTNCHAEGSNTEASGNCSHAEGWGTTASGYWSHAEGEHTTASQMHSHAEGNYTTASGDASHAEGSSTIASGLISHAEGQSTKAAGWNSHAEGDSTEASELASHAEGSQSKAKGQYSHAEGRSSIASGEASHAEGDTATASGKASHAEGWRVTAFGEDSHAEGYMTEAKKLASHAEGFLTTADSAYQHVQGKHNVVDSNNTYADIVGGGEEDWACNIEATTWTGDKRMHGNVYVECEDDSTGGKKLQKEEISDPDNLFENKTVEGALKELAERAPEIESEEAEETSIEDIVQMVIDALPLYEGGSY